jgi:hypothetical protein
MSSPGWLHGIFLFISCDLPAAVNCSLEDLPFIHIVVGQRPWVPNRAMLGFEPRAYLQQVGAPTKYIYWYRWHRVSVFAHSAGAYTANLFVMVNVVKRGGRHASVFCTAESHSKLKLTLLDQGKSWGTHDAMLQSGVEVKVVLAIIVLFKKEFGSWRSMFFSQCLLRVDSMDYFFILLTTQ